MAEFCAFSRSGANSVSVGSCPDFAEDEEEKEVTERCCPWERGSVAAVATEHTGKSDEPISCELLRETQTSPSGQETCSDLLSVLVSACSCSLHQLPLVSDKAPQSGTFFHRSFLLEQSFVSLVPYFSSKGYFLLIIKTFPFISVTDIKEATPLKLNSTVTKQNKIIESRRDVGLLT